MLVTLLVRGHWPPCETEAYQEQLGVAPPVARTHRQQGLTEIGLFLCAQTLQPNNGPKKSVYLGIWFLLEERFGGERVRGFTWSLGEWHAHAPCRMACLIHFLVDEPRSAMHVSWLEEHGRGLVSVFSKNLAT